MMSEPEDEKNPTTPAAPDTAEPAPAVSVPAKKASAPPPAEDFAALLAASEAPGTGGKDLKDLQVGDLVRGRVIAVGQSSAFVAIGAKGEAQMDLAEFRDTATGELTVKEGDTIEATVTDDGATSGSIKLKKTLGRGAHVSEELEQAFASGAPIEGLVAGEVKGGYEVQIGQTRAFCPGSQIDMRRGQRTPAGVYVGQRFQFRVTKLEAGGRNVVVSRRKLLEGEAAALAEKTWERIEVGAVIEGCVTSIRDFGAFVDIGGVDGLVHISELSYGRVGHPSELLTEGQTVQVQIIKVEGPGEGSGRRQIGLSLKALADDPWDSVQSQFSEGTTVPGVVRRLEQFGAFVEIAPGLDGLVHISKIVMDRRIAHPRNVLNEGDPVEVTVIAVDSKKRRISLSMIEKARGAKSAADARERAEEKAAVEEQNAPANLGTFADLLSNAKKD